MKNIFISLITILILNSCATIIGGARYKAHIYVKNGEGAKIFLNGKNIGKRSQQLIKRKDANKVSFVIKKEGFKSQNIVFQKREFRSSALLGSVLSGIGARTETGPGYSRTYFTYFPIFLIDLFNFSSLWKPDVSEYGVNKINYKNFKYELTFKADPLIPVKIKHKEITPEAPQKNELQIQKDKLRDLKKMYEEEIIDEQEYKLMKLRILGLENSESKRKTQPNDTINIKTKILEGSKEDEIETIEVDTNLENNDSNKKLEDLNKMLELKMITQQEYDEMKIKLIDNK